MPILTQRAEWYACKVHKNSTAAAGHSSYGHDHARSLLCTGAALSPTAPKRVAICGQ
jgi:hypothetical protein